jgi:drug/metabolite transporter (DMT)-like permease
MWLVFVVLASVGFGIGAAMQKHGVASRLPGLSVRTAIRDSRRVIRAVFSNRLWLVGGAANLCGAFFLVLAIDAGDLTVVQPLTNLNLVVSVLAGVLVLREKLSETERLGVIAMLGGATLLSVSGLRSHGATAIAPLHVLLAAGAASLGAVGLLNLAGRLSRARLRPEIVLGASAGVLYGMGTVCVKVLTTQLDEVVGARAIVLTTLLSPALLGVVAANVMAYTLEQIAFSRGRVSVVDPLCTGGALVMPVAVGALALAEPVDGLRALGLAVVGSALGLLLWRGASARAPGDAPAAPGG